MTPNPRRAKQKRKDPWKDILKDLQMIRKYFVNNKNYYARGCLHSYTTAMTIVEKHMPKRNGRKSAK